MSSVSAVIVNFNGGDSVINCIGALTCQEVSFESITVIDNGSTDGSAIRIRNAFPDVHVFETGQNLGLTKARNIGLQKTKTDVVLLLDDDVYVAKNCLRYMLDAYHQNHATIVCPRVILTPERNIVQCDGAESHFVGTMLLRHGYTPVKEAPTEARTVGSCIGACLLIDRAKVLAAGGFDEAYFFYFEDLELSMRLRATGHQLYCEPKAVVFHDRGEGTPNLSFRGNQPYPHQRVRLTLRHRLMTMLIHYRLRTFVVLLPTLLLYELTTLVIVVIRGWGAEWAKANLWLIRNISSIWEKRQRIQKKRILNDKDILVGGPIPLAPGFVHSPVATFAVTSLSTLMNIYWLLVRRLIG